MIKSFIECTKGYRKNVILTPIFVAFEVILEIFLPKLAGILVNIVNLYDAYPTDELRNEAINKITAENSIMGFLFREIGTSKESMTYIITIIGICVVIMALLSLLFGYLAGKHCSIASAAFAKNIREREFYNIQNFSFANIDKFSSSSLLTRLSSDIMHVRMAFQNIIRNAVRSPLMIIFALIATFMISPEIAWIFLIVVPVLGFGLLFISRFVHPLFEKVFYEYDNLNSVIQENVRGVRVVKSFVKEEDEKVKFNKVSDKIYNGFIKAEKILAVNSPFMQACVYTTLIIICFIGAQIIWTPESTFSVGDLSAILSYASSILSSLMMFSFVYVHIMISRPSAERIYEVFCEKPTIVNPENPVKVIKDGSIEFKNVSFSYSGDENKLALKNANIKIESGQTIGILGGTGSAKSTLVQLIPRLYDVTTGEVLVGGINVKDYDLTLLRDSVSMVLQKNLLFSGTIKENMRWGKEDATDEEIINACKIAQADDFIKDFPDGYDTHIEQGGTNVSGGQKQRLCIARALLKSPKILILDDSTSAVDTKTDALIRNEFKNYIPEITKIIISQRVASVEDADQIIIMDDGKIDQIGTSEELLKTNKIYQEIYNQQTGGNKWTKQKEDRQNRKT